jgi:hypothetical protein
MNVRFLQRGLGAAVVFVLGCGGEGTSAPPPEYPGPAPTLETTSAAPADKPMETARMAGANEPAAPAEGPTQGGNAAACHGGLRPPYPPMR